MAEADLIQADQNGVASPQSVFISFMAEVIPGTAEALVSVVAQHMMQGKTDIHLMLSTPGGQVAAGIAAYNMLRREAHGDAGLVAARGVDRVQGDLE